MKGALNLMVLIGFCLAAEAVDCPRWLSVMPLNEDNIASVSADAVSLGNETVVDGIAWSFSIRPSGDPAADLASVYAARYRQMEPLVRSASKVRLGVLMQSTMGHGGLPGSPSRFQRVVRPDGTSIYRMCPLDPDFLSYIAAACRTFSALKPDFFMIDDDTRLTLGNESPGCFCPLHLAEFGRRTGRTWTREEVLAAVRSDIGIKSAWAALTADSLAGLMRVIRDNYDPSIPGILCVCHSAGHIEHARRLAEILAAPGQVPTIRGNGAPFHNYGKDLLHIVELRSQYARQLSQVGPGVIFMQEADTCPHTLWMCSATRLVDHLVMLALDGVKGAKIWITRMGNNHEQRSGRNYRRAFRENCGLMKWAADVHFRQEGVVVPVQGPVQENFGDLYLGLAGIPYRFGKARSGEITALTAATLKTLTRSEIEDILAGRVIGDGTAAVWLSENGYSGDIGVTAKPWRLKTIQVHELADGKRQSGLRVNADMADLTACYPQTRVLSRLYNRASLGAQPEYVAPGAVSYENARGGKIVLLAQPLPPAVPISYAQTMLSESYKQWIVGLLRALGGSLPGGVCYRGDGPAVCLSGTTQEGERILVLDLLDLDGDDAPEFVFDKVPDGFERLQGDGTWKEIGFSHGEGNAVTLRTRIETQRTAIFRLGGK